METEYSVTCGCGRIHQVSGGAAGSVLSCACGNQLEVPSLAVLRRSAGEPVVSPEIEIRFLLQSKELPQEHNCLRCWAETTEISQVLVECERAEVSLSGEWNFSWLAFLFLGHLAFWRSTETKERGRNISFCLPLRLCRDCARQLGRSALIKVMCQVPVYARLLEKYPHAKVSLDIS